MNKSGKYFFLLFYSFVSCFGVYSQTARISGKVYSELNEPLEKAYISVTQQNKGEISNTDGSYMIEVEADQTIIITCSFVGYKTINDTISVRSGEIITRNYILHPDVSNLTDVIVTEKDRENNITRINMKSIDQLPNSSGNIESLLKTQIGVAGGNELSSQYSVRGGNFDENLVYVNDIEIYRPLLVQNSLQEGLSFVNPSMVSSLQF